MGKLEDETRALYVGRTAAGPFKKPKSCQHFKPKIRGCGAKFCNGYEPGAVVPALRLIVEILCFQERSFGPWYKFLVGGVAMLVSNVITVDQPLMLIVIV